MRHAILVTGPNASGKTTAVTDALRPWARDRRLVVIYADNSNRSAFKGTMTDMVARLQTEWESAAELLVIEGTNRIATVAGYLAWQRELWRTREFEAHVTQMDGDFMRASIEGRCQKLGKRYRDDYWTPRVLGYEGGKRYRNLIHQYFGGKATYYTVEAGYAGAQALGEAIRQRADAILGLPVQPVKAEEVGGGETYAPKPGSLF